MDKSNLYEYLLAVWEGVQVARWGSDSEWLGVLDYWLFILFQVLLGQYKATGKLYAIKALKKQDIISRDEIDRWVSIQKQHFH